MLDLTNEQAISLEEAAKLIPPSRGARRTQFSTLLRWITKGVRSPSGDVVRLDAIRVGGRWVTSAQAVQRFGEALTPRLDGDRPPAPRTPDRRRRAAERAGRQLEKLGI